MLRISSSTYYQQAAAFIDQGQTQVSTLQTELASGLGVQTASDNPVAYGQILGVNQAISDTAQWQSNASALTSSLGTEDSTLTDVGNSLQQIQQLALQANNATTNSSDRQSIAAEMQQQLNQIVQDANAQDGTGNYLFGGTETSSAPFTQTASGVSYGGNSDLRMLSLGPTSEIAASDPGDSVFMQTQSGNGTISVAAASGNTGNATVTSYQVTSPSQFTGGQYSVQFSGGNYQVLNSSNAVVASGAYTSGNAIQFAGVSLTITGTPADGDSFTVGPSSTQSLFTTVQNLITAVSSGATGAQGAQNQTALIDSMQALSTAQNHISNVLAGVGSRQQAVTNASSQLTARTTQLQTTLSGLQDLDYAAATTQLAQSQTTLQAAEQSYVQIQGLSLFNYIK
jgi:flagellar hook-associated protein 3 FlgL